LGRSGESINIVFVSVRAPRNLPQNAARQAAFEINPVTERKIASELYAAADGMNLLGAEPEQFIC
jgi:hypothetical protein